MTVETATDWQVIREEVERFFHIPDDLDKNGISALRAMIFRRRDRVTRLVLNIEHGEAVGFIKDLDSFVWNCFEQDYWQDMTFKLGTYDNPNKGLVTKEIMGDLVIIEYCVFEGEEVPAAKLATALSVIAGGYANRNQ